MNRAVLRSIAFGLAIYVLLQAAVYFSLHQMRPWAGQLAIGIFLAGVFAHAMQRPCTFLWKGTLLALWVASPLLIYALGGNFIAKSQVYNTIGLAMGVAFPCLFLFDLCKHRAASLLFAGVCAILFVPVLLYWGYDAIAGAPLGATALLAIYQTNPEEAKGFLTAFFPLIGGVMILISVLLYVLFAWKALLRRDRVKSLGRRRLAALVVLALGSFGWFFSSDHLYHVLAQQTQEGIAQYHAFAAAREQRAHRADALPSVTAQHPGLYVLVIGESQNKHHMSAYGYEKETTPWLDAMKSDPHMLFFEKGNACFVNTVSALSYALTSKNQYNDVPLEQSLTLVESAKAAGFQTAWLSNQVKYGVWDTPVAVIASEADQQQWLNSGMGTITDTPWYDEKLAEALQDADHYENQLIVIHLIGNHGDYRDRYPKSYAVDPETSSVNSYDNSIRYNDAVVEKIYDVAKTLPHFQAMVYVADHADDVDRDLGHDPARFTQAMADIPFYMLLSDDYMASAPETVETLRSHCWAMFTNDLIYNVMLGLMGIEIPGIYEEQNNLASPAYDDAPERFRVLDGAQKLQDGTGE